MTRKSKFRFFSWLTTSITISCAFLQPALGQSIQQQYGLPDSSHAIFENGLLSIPCLHHIKGGRVAAYYGADLRALTAQFPITFEVIHLAPTDACEGITTLNGNTVSGVVQTTTATVPYWYALTYLGADASGRLLLSLDSSSLYKVQSASPTLTAASGREITFVPTDYNPVSNYQLIEPYSSEVLNTKWKFRPSFNSVSFTPETSGKGTVLLVDHAWKTVQFVQYEATAPTNPTLQLQRKSSFGGFFGSSGFEQETIPFICQLPSCVRTANASVIGATTYQHGTYKLVAEGADFVVTSTSARDLNGRTSASITGLAPGTVIRAGNEVQFTLNSGLTQGQEALLQWSVEIEGMGVVLLETVRFRSN